MIHDGQRPNAPMWTQKVFNGDAEEGELAKKVSAIMENEIINKLRILSSNLISLENIISQESRLNYSTLMA